MRGHDVEIFTTDPMHLFSLDLLHHLAQAYGLWVLFGVVLLECMGVPMPGETALVSAALYAGSTHRIGIAAVVAVAALAAIIGGNIGYVVGRTVGFRLLLRYGRHVRLDERRLKVGQYLFLRHGGKIVFLGRFIALLRTYAPLLAGTNRMPWLPFEVMNALGGICWAALFGVGAYLFGAQATHLGGAVSVLLLVAAAALVIAGLVFFRRHEDELVRRAELAIPGPLRAADQ
jgi:membrane protein DedA with SNARE-associated domain